jgi:tetratricopeptide (TPR) repeat protein
MKIMKKYFALDKMNQIEFARDFFSKTSATPDEIADGITDDEISKIGSRGLTGNTASVLISYLSKDDFITYLNNKGITDDSAVNLILELQKAAEKGEVECAVNFESDSIDKLFESLFNQYSLFLTYYADKRSGKASKKKEHKTSEPTEHKIETPTVQKSDESVIKQPETHFERSIDSFIERYREDGAAQDKINNIPLWDKHLYTKLKIKIKRIVLLVCICIIVSIFGIARAKGMSIVEFIKDAISSEPSQSEEPPEPEPEPEPDPPDEGDMSWPTPYKGMEPGEQTGDPLAIEAYDTSNILLLSKWSMFADVIDGQIPIETVDTRIKAFVEQWVRVDAGIDDVSWNRDFENNVASAKQIVENDPDYTKIRDHINNIRQWPVADDDENVIAVKSASESSREILGRAIEYYEAALSISAQPGVLERAADAYLIRGQYYYINGMNNEAFEDYSRAIELTQERIKLMEFDESGIEIQHRSNFARLLGNLGLIYYRLALTDNGSITLECYLLSAAFYKQSAEHYVDNSAVMAQNYYYAAMMNHKIIYQKHRQEQCRNFIIEALKLYKKATGYESTSTPIPSLEDLLTYARTYNAAYPDSRIDLSGYL